ncbi:menaquinone-dependent protoporphyrinogen IX oxidase [Treponema ruminis]|uniref:Menaquinone-dependent protoporphyrinogen IX oxidase n=1 Tax=Treponema ruminis TaxID=744515 RepID=A0A7W8LMR1_9SPIR|nr:menaquinone-dependent protoporphyrinogen IX oxidase [Treponema ruminis]
MRAIADKYPEVELIDATKTILKDLASYDLIGFASGIFYGKLHKSLISFITDNLPAHKKAFVIYTCGQDSPSYIKSVEELIKSKDAAFAGYYYDTWSPFKLIGGKNKERPNADDIQKAVEFYEGICK